MKGDTGFQPVSSETGRMPVSPSGQGGTGFQPVSSETGRMPVLPSGQGGTGFQPVLSPYRTKSAFKGAVSAWARRIRVKPEQVRIQRMLRKWASCSTNGRVSFNARLLRQPRAFQDYVIVHELLHLRVPNHGKLFKSLLSVYLPTVASPGGRMVTVHGVLFLTGPPTACGPV